MRSMWQIMDRWSLRQDLLMVSDVDENRVALTVVLAYQEAHPGSTGGEQRRRMLTEVRMVVQIRIV